MSDAERFEAFLRQYQDMVYATAIRLLGREADAEDVAQGVFLKAFERFDVLVASPSAGAWLKTVATNLCLNHLSRYRARWRFFSELGSDAEAGDADFASNLPAGHVTSAELDARDRHRRLERGLRALPDHQRVPLVLYHFEDKSYRAIADLLGTSMAKVKTDIHRGRIALRRLLDDDDRTR